MPASIQIRARDDVAPDLQDLFNSLQATGISPDHGPGGNTAVAVLAGPFTGEVSRIWGKRIGEYLAAPDARRHIWHAWLSSMRSDCDLNGMSSSLAYSELTFTRGRELIEQAFGT